MGFADVDAAEDFVEGGEAEVSDLFLVVEAEDIEDGLEEEIGVVAVAEVGDEGGEGGEEGELELEGLLVEEVGEEGDEVGAGVGGAEGQGDGGEGFDAAEFEGRLF